MTPIESALYRATHSVQNADVRWAAERATGVDDDRLARLLAREFGIGGGGSEGFSYDAHGCGDWWGSLTQPSRPSPVLELTRPERVVLKGRALLETARRVLEMPEPGGSR